MYGSFKNIGVDSSNDLLEDGKTQEREWIRQLRAHLDNLGLKTNRDQDNWLQNRATKLQITVGGDFNANANDKRSQTIQCANENYGRMLHSKKKDEQASQNPQR